MRQWWRPAVPAVPACSTRCLVARTTSTAVHHAMQGVRTTPRPCISDSLNPRRHACAQLPLRLNARPAVWASPPRSPRQRRSTEPAWCGTTCPPPPPSRACSARWRCAPTRTLAARRWCCRSSPSRRPLHAAAGCWWTSSTWHPTMCCSACSRRWTPGCVGIRKEGCTTVLHMYRCAAVHAAGVGLRGSWAKERKVGRTTVLQMFWARFLFPAHPGVALAVRAAYVMA